mgnify:FL=1
MLPGDYWFEIVLVDFDLSVFSSDRTAHQVKVHCLFISRDGVKQVERLGDVLVFADVHSESPLLGLE